MPVDLDTRRTAEYRQICVHGRRRNGGGSDPSTEDTGPRFYIGSHTCCNEGLTENTPPENDGPSKSRGMKMQDMKITDQIAEVFRVRC